MINKVILVGNVGSDIEFKQITESQCVTNFSLATHNNYKKKDGGSDTKTEWHNITAWRSNALFARDYIKKGMLIYVEGEINNSFYTNADNLVVKTYTILANHFDILDRKG